MRTLSAVRWICTLSATTGSSRSAAFAKTHAHHVPHFNAHTFRCALDLHVIGHYRELQIGGLCQDPRAPRTALQCAPFPLCVGSARYRPLPGAPDRRPLPRPTRTTYRTSMRTLSAVRWICTLSATT